ncbi:MAG: ATP-dependent zinc metalloprotease FtsH [Planctomycetes bacterium]|nr:ATP-dependent zinc metalloprotease FtsH [Planctomycetota bacterium]
MMWKNLSPAPISWSHFLDNIAKGEVLEVEIGPEFALVKGTKPAGDKEYRVYYPTGRLGDTVQKELLEIINTYNAEAKRPKDAASPNRPTPINIKGVQPAGFLSAILPQLLVIALLVGLFYFFVLRRMGQGGGVLSFGKSRAQLITKGKTGKTFKDVAGIDEAKEEVEELVAFLKNPKKFQKLGGRIPRGVLLVGPPGTGKTLLAKAIAGEADVPFYSISGSDFVEMFVGVGASRVRDLFNQSKENSPCIIFIDEIDAVGRKRGNGTNSGGHDEREQTLNAILVEMDGFSSTDKVIVIAATNRVDVLDPALLRPGRFDRHIYVSLPDIAGREQILGVHCGKVKMGPNCNLSIIARGTPGFSGADLESLINEAALNAARYDQEIVMHKDLEYARDRVAFGQEKKTGSRAMPEKERKITAYHEAGHAILQMIVEEKDDLHKVTIIPRGRSLGSTMHLPTEDRHTHGKRKLLCDISILFGGRISEEIFCGDITTGASNDIERATDLARGMVYEWGMSEKMGPLKYTEEHDGLMGHESVVTAGNQTRRELDEEVRSIIDAQYALAKDLILANRDKLVRVAEALLEHETLDVLQVKLLMDGGELPPRRPTVIVTKAEIETKEPRSEPERSATGPALEPKLA